MAELSLIHPSYRSTHRQHVLRYGELEDKLLCLCRELFSSFTILPVGNG